MTPTLFHPDGTPPPWRGWLRPAGTRRWQPVVSGASENEAWAALLDHQARGDRLVLCGDRDPNTEERRR